MKKIILIFASGLFSCSAPREKHKYCLNLKFIDGSERVGVFVLPKDIYFTSETNRGAYVLKYRFNDVRWNEDNWGTEIKSAVIDYTVLTTKECNY